MAQRIEIALKRGVHDARGTGVVAKARNFFHLPLSACSTRDVYKVDVALSQPELHEIRDVFTDPVIARAAVGRLAAPMFDWLIEVGFKPGVTDNLGRTAQEVVTDVIGRALAAQEGVYTSVQYFLKSALTREQAQRLGRDLLANELIQTIGVFTPEEWAAAPVDAAP